jgi:hypothetical protein
MSPVIEKEKIEELNIYLKEKYPKIEYQLNFNDATATMSILFDSRILNTFNISDSIKDIEKITDSKFDHISILINQHEFLFKFNQKQLI